MVDQNERYNLTSREIISCSLRDSRLHCYSAKRPHGRSAGCLWGPPARRLGSTCQCLPCAWRRGARQRWAHQWPLVQTAAVRCGSRPSLLFCLVSRLAHGQTFAVCPTFGTRQRGALPSRPSPSGCCRVLLTANISPCAKVQAHGK